MGPWKSGLDLSGPFDLSAYLTGQNVHCSGNIFLWRNRQKVVAQGRVPCATMTGASRRDGREVEGAHGLSNSGLGFLWNAWENVAMDFFFLRDGRVVKDLASLLMGFFLYNHKGTYKLQLLYSVCLGECNCRLM